MEVINDDTADSKKKMICLLESLIKDPTQGLPEDIFLFVSRLTPMINVDLLIKNEQNQTLLIWRDDGYWTPGWHIPGGIIRYKEKILDRIKAVAKCELGAAVECKEVLLSMCEIIGLVQKNRGHFISLLYECTLVSMPDEHLRFKGGVPRSGEWMWHNTCPDNLVTVQDIYRKFI